MTLLIEARIWARDVPSADLCVESISVLDAAVMLGFYDGIEGGVRECMARAVDRDDERLAAQMEVRLRGILLIQAEINTAIQAATTGYAERNDLEVL